MTFHKLKVDVIDSVRISKNSIEDVNNKIEATDNYLARYLPFNNFCTTMDITKNMMHGFLKLHPEQREKMEQYEQAKLEDLYSAILFDDGRAPKVFEKDHLVVGRNEINEKIRKNKIKQRKELEKQQMHE
mmetsp:Transcript_24441/g.37900  ORF Transcript_24441/g.37900 Transcript_24441/m.37900 type:complete len:130 (+) Transcript_24441:1137-1526(+)|eukprot:CAMPEP_0170503436 /NCGR_PEP_ID=MMETSP0208-20121228/44749_1 /TAXON_ID=197538 /ORGANISM="Strombidium inclinatum, Strain S3" /LENGTH=129 /DNA_ID=CAMNT_0010783103 /DNA_START=1115 /DNA_END=1504 /DNA_ORIENTATION=-